MSSVARLSTSRYARPGALIVVAAGLIALLASLVTSATNVTVANAQSESDFTLDGSINESAYGSFGSLTYTQDDGETIPNGLISVVETNEAYWIAFQQSLTAKSNAYCENKDEAQGCYQKWGDLRGSDYIGFMWTAQQTGTSELSFGVDVISEDNGGYTGTVGTGDGDEVEYGDQKAKDNPALVDAVRGLSSMHYNMNTVGWTNTTVSPNFTPEQDGQGYVYPSIAEVRLDKQGLGLPSGIADQLRNATVETHNSPQAPFDDEGPRRFITCVDTSVNEVAVGESATVTFEASEDGQPTQGLNVLVFTEGPGEVVSVGGNQGQTGATGTDGRVDAVIQATGAGETQILAVIDQDGDGEYDEGVEPITSPPCRINAAGQPADITVQVDKTNDADGNDSYTDSEAAPNEGAAVPFRAVVTNTSQVNIVIEALTDEWTTEVGALAIDLLSDGYCPQLDGLVLEPGESATCLFDVDDYAPAAGEVQPDTVTTTVHEEGDEGNTASDEDDSQVRTPAPGDITVNVDKTNDADGDGTYTDDETAPAPGASVEFRAIVTNTSADVNVRIDELFDTYQAPGSDAIPVIDLLAAENCPQLDGLVLEPGESATCFFTVTDYAPSAGENQPDTVSTTVSEGDNPDNTTSDEDDSNVRSPAPGEITVNVNKANDADADGDFNDVETSVSGGQAVDFEVVVTNTSSESSVIIRELTDDWPVGSLDLLATNGCSVLEDVMLEPGQSERCVFTVEDYSRPLEDVVNVARVEVEDEEVPGNTASDEDDSTVQAPQVSPTETERTPSPSETPTTPGPAPTTPGPDVSPTMHPRTGVNSAVLGVGGLVLLIFGAAFLLYGEHRRRLAEGR